MMKTVQHTFLLLLVLSLFSSAEPLTPKSKPNSATRVDVKVIEASENIRYISQKIAKTYLFYYKNPTRMRVKQELAKMLEILNTNFRSIVLTTKDSDTKDILEFLAYSKDQMEEIFAQSPNEERAALMLDYSETVLEGADSISQAHIYDFTEEEKMLMIAKEMEYLLERIGKFYMALNVGFNTKTHQEAIQTAMRDFEQRLARIDLYRYPVRESGKKEAVNNAWEVNRGFFERFDSLFIPILMDYSVTSMEKNLAQLVLYHSKNQ